MIAFIDDAADIPLRLTNRHGLLGSFNIDPVTGARTFVAEGGVFEDAWQSGYVDIDDLLASSDLGIQDVLVHFITERRATPNYAHRMGIPGGQPGGLDTRPGFDQEFQRAHAAGLRAELALLRDFFGDPGIRAIDLQARVFRSTRGDTIRVRITEGHTAATSGIQAVSFEVVLHDTHAVITRRGLPGPARARARGGCCCRRCGRRCGWCRGRALTRLRVRGQERGSARTPAAISSGTARSAPAALESAAAPCLARS